MWMAARWRMPSQAVKKYKVERVSNNKRVFITGGASGLGRAMALRYAKQGCRVCIGDINAERAAEVVAEINQAGGTGLFKHCDVTSEANLQTVADELRTEWQGIDVLINNAGVATAGSIESFSLDDWQWVIDINVLGVVRGCKAFVPLLKQQKSGHIINTASLAGVVSPPMMSSYNATKAAVIALSETLHAELSPYNIGVTVACPSFFRTNLGESLRSSEPGIDKMIERLFERAKIDADGVAEKICKGADKGEFMVLPVTEDKRLWQVKRASPALFRKLIIRRFAKMGQKRSAKAS